MSLPENPESRLEQYLQNIATGEGEYPANPDSRLEQYLDYIIEHGGSGGSVPTPTAADAGKVPVAQEDGTYTLGEKADKPSVVTTGTAITLADNTIYNLSDVTTLDIAFPASGSYHAHINLTTAASGTITITLPAGSLFIGAKPTFATGETWEIDIADGKVCAAKAVAAT